MTLAVDRRHTGVGRLQSSWSKEALVTTDVPLLLQVILKQRQVRLNGGATAVVLH